MALAGGLRLTAAGMALGVFAAALLTRFMRGMLFEVAPLDPVAFGAVMARLSLVAAAACAVPAARASWIDPAAVLRQD